MFTPWSFLMFLLMGVVVGYLARLLVPGRHRLTFFQTMLLGVVGSFVGGFLGYVLFGYDEGEGAIQPAGVIGSLIGTIIALLVWRSLQRRR